MDRTLVAFDTETATRHGPPHLLEIGAVRIVDGELAEHFSTLVLPEVEIEPETEEIHGITDAMTRQAPELPTALREFFDWLGGDWLVAHDAPQDAHVLAFECARHGLPTPDQPILDTLALSKRYLPEAPDHSLESLIGLLELEQGDAHRALDDAVSCAKILEECVARATAEDGSSPGAEALLKASKRLTTIAGSGPSLPRLPRRLRPLETCARSGEPVTLHYADPGQHPVPLPVLPRLIYKLRDRGYLEGECQNAGILKTYRLDRIQRVTVD